MKFLRALTAATLLGLILAAAPWLLIQLGQLPGFLPSWGQWSLLLTSPDTGRLFLVLIWVAAWGLWLWLTILILTELVAAIRGLTPPTLPGGSLLQPLMRGLVLAAIGALVTAPTPTAVAAPLATPDPVTTTAATAASSWQRTQEAPAEGQLETVVVERGDTLWSLADQHLGDPERWPELFELNRGIEQHTGYSLEDPDAIDVGWRLRLPTETAPAQPETHPSPALNTLPAVDELPNDEHAASTTTDTPQPSEATTSEQPSAPLAGTTLNGQPDDEREHQLSSVIDAENQTPFPWQVAGLAGAGSILGVGMATMLATRRREQFRTRRPGATIAAPIPELAPIEKSAHLAVGLSARLVDRVHAVLRRLAGTVPVDGIVIARDGTIQIVSDGQLEAPWVSEPGGWLLPNSTPVELLGPDIPDAPCAYPLIVTIGADIDDRIVLINLETIGQLTLAGDQLMRDDFARYITAELGLNPWAEGIRVACHGPAADTIGMAPNRLDATDTEILAIARRNLTRTENCNLSTPAGRATQAEEENWPAAAILLNSNDASDLATLITRHPGRTGTAVVAIADEQAILTLSPSGRVRGLGMELTAVGLTEDEAAGCAALLQTTDEESTSPPPADDLTDVTGNLLREHRVARDDPFTEAAILPAPDEEYLAAAATTSDDLTVLAPRISTPVAEELKTRDPSLDHELELWFSDTCPYPRLALLGPVTARCYGKPMAKQKAYYTEVLAYLALHPKGVTGDQVAEAFGVTLQRARTVISNLRNWVGINPQTREPHIPDAKSSPQAQSRGIGLYLVQDLLLDIDLFRRLHTRALAVGSEGIDDLETALKLVQGRPFEQLRPAGWTWLLEGDRIDHHMVSAIGDVAHILVTHHLHTGDYEAAKLAASTALSVDPDSEIARLDLAAIMVETGHSELAREALSEALGDKAELDLTLRGHSIIRRKASAS